MGKTLDVREGDKWKLCHHSAIKSGKESMGSQPGMTKESLAIKRAKKHCQQATRADKTTGKAKKSCCFLQSPLYALHQGGSPTPPRPSTHRVSRLP